MGQIQWVGMFASLRHPSFRLLWTSTLLWSTSRWMEIVVLGWLVLELTGSPFLVGLVTAMRGVPFLFFGALGGVVADRVPSRTRLLAYAQSGIVALTLLLAALVSTGLLQVWHLMVLAFLSGTAMAFDQPARQTLVYDLVREDLVNALAMNSTAWNVARMLGPAVAGVLLGWVGAGGCFAAMAVLQFVGVGSILLVGAPARVNTSRVDSVWQNLKEGLSYALHSPVPRTLLLVEAVTDIAALPYIFVLMPVFARDVLSVGATGLGFMTASAGIGALAGALTVAFIGDRLRKGLVTIISVLLFGLFLFLFSITSWYPLALVLLALTGTFNTIQMNLEAVLLQTTVPEEMRGRMIGAYVLTWGVMPVGNLQAGTVAALAGAPVAGAAGGIVLVLFALVLARFAGPLRRA